MRGHELNCKYHNVASLAQLEKKRTGEPGTTLLPQGGRGALGPASSRCSTTETSALPVRPHKTRTNSTAQKSVKC